MRRLLASVGSIAIAATALVVTTATSAAAVSNYETATSWAFVDSGDPGSVVVDAPGDAPLGTWTDDGGTHTARPYFTFDLSRYQGARIISAKFSSGETDVADCTDRPNVSLWRTTPFTAGPPSDLVKVSTNQVETCPASYMDWDATKAVKAAVADGERTLTLSLRLPDNLASRPAMFRKLRAAAGLAVEFNNPPDVPTDLATAATACTTDKPYTIVRNDSVTLQARATDPDVNEAGGHDRLTGRFEVWRVGSTEPRTVLERSGYAPAVLRPYLLPEELIDGATYAWRVRVTDEAGDRSPWSETCRFVVDKQAPTGTVTVSSTDYPDDGQWYDAVGRPGAFHLAYTGTDKIAGFYWSSIHGDGRSHYVAADRRGRATITYAPGDAVDRIDVHAVDAAGYRTEETTYTIRAVDQRPTIDGYLWETGQPATFTFNSFNGTAVEFRYHLDGEPEQTVAADGDGRAQVEITARLGGERILTVTSRTADGVHATRADSWWLPSEPLIFSTEYPQYEPAGGLGIAGSFTFTARSAGAVEFRYRFSDGAAGTVPVGPDGNAVVQWAPTAVGSTDLLVWAVDAHGEETAPAVYWFTVADRRPAVWSDIYHESGSHGGPGQTGQFSFSTELDHFEFVYRFDDGPEQTATIFDGVAYTPTTAGPHELRVRSRGSDGTESPERVYRFVVFGGPLVVSQEYPRDVTSGRPGLEGTFTFLPQLPGVVSYRYAFDDEAQRTVAASAEGVADVRYAPTFRGPHSLTVSSVDAEGTASEPTVYGFFVRDDVPFTQADNYGWGPWGGVGVEDWFHFSSQLPDTVDFAYRLNDGPEQIVAAESGQASVRLAPDRAGENVLTLVARAADGRRSPPHEFRFEAGNG